MDRPNMTVMQTLQRYAATIRQDSRSLQYELLNRTRSVRIRYLLRKTLKNAGLIYKTLVAYPKLGEIIIEDKSLHPNATFLFLARLKGIIEKTQGMKTIDMFYKILFYKCRIHSICSDDKVQHSLSQPASEFNRLPSTPPCSPPPLESTSSSRQGPPQQYWTTPSQQWTPAEQFWSSPGQVPFQQWNPPQLFCPSPVQFPPQQWAPPQIFCPSPVQFPSQQWGPPQPFCPSPVQFPPQQWGAPEQFWPSPEVPPPSNNIAPFSHSRYRPSPLRVVTTSSNTRTVRPSQTQTRATNSENCEKPYSPVFCSLTGLSSPRQYMDSEFFNSSDSLIARVQEPVTPSTFYMKVPTKNNGSDSAKKAERNHPTKSSEAEAKNGVDENQSKQNKEEDIKEVKADVMEADVMDTDVTVTDVKEISMTETDVKEINVKEADVKETNVTDTSMTDTSVTDTSVNENKVLVRATLVNRERITPIKLSEPAKSGIYIGVVSTDRVLKCYWGDEVCVVPVPEAIIETLKIEYAETPQLFRMQVVTCSPKNQFLVEKIPHVCSTDGKYVLIFGRNYGSTILPESESVVYKMLEKRIWKWHNNEVKEAVNRSGCFTIHNNEEDTYTCSLCKMNFSSVLRCNRHIILHAKTDALDCEFCGNNFTRVDAFQRHVQSRCQGIAPSELNRKS